MTIARHYRLAALALGLILPCAHGQPPATPDSGPGTEARLETKTGTLSGTFDLPKGAGPFPVIIIIAGSGPTDRDGNQVLMRNDSLKMLGQGLAAKGIAVLRYDRRGVGKSMAAAPKEQDLRFDHLIDDAVEWVKLLRTDKRFSKVAIGGHSEGALVSLVAAKRAKADAYVSISGAGRPIPAVLREQLSKLPKELKDK